jgi:aminoglycoside phosphotransferase (APT) family kinase protein
VHLADDELALLDAELELVRGVWPDVADRVACLVAPARQALRAAGTVPAVVCHGDFTPSQLLLHREGVALVDLDCVRRADPASDAGRFLAYLDARAARGRATACPGGDAPGGELLAAYGRAGGASGPRFLARVRSYRSVSLARMALHATRQLKDRRLDIALGLLAVETESEGVLR